jgi:hypothetical protein
MISSLLKIVPFALYFVKTSFKNSSMTSRGGTHPGTSHCSFVMSFDEKLMSSNSRSFSGFGSLDLS